MNNAASRNHRSLFDDHWFQYEEVMYLWENLWIPLKFGLLPENRRRLTCRDDKTMGCIFRCGTRAESLAKLSLMGVASCVMWDTGVSVISLSIS